MYIYSSALTTTTNILYNVLNTTYNSDAINRLYYIDVAPLFSSTALGSFLFYCAVAAWLAGLCLSLPLALGYSGNPAMLFEYTV